MTLDVSKAPGQDSLRLCRVIDDQLQKSKKAEPAFFLRQPGFLLTEDPLLSALSLQRDWLYRESL
jgi:hypothetical protein